MILRKKTSGMLIEISVCFVSILEIVWFGQSWWCPNVGNFEYDFDLIKKLKKLIFLSK